MISNTINNFYKFSIIAGLLILPVVLSAQQGHSPREESSKTEERTLDDYLRISDSLLQIKKPHDPGYRPGLGIISESEITERTFDAEEYFRRYATLPLEEAYEDMNYFYDDYVMHLGEGNRQNELERMKKVARELKSRRLEEETLFLDVFLIYGSDWSKEIAWRWKVAQQFEKEGKRILALRLKSDLFNKARVSGVEQYYQSFIMAEELLEDLEKVTEEEFPRKRAVYGEIGHLYYHFRDYDNAIPLLEKALTDKSIYFFDSANLRARNTLAVYYHTIGDLEKSAYYFRSMLDSPDNVFQRAMFSAIALAGLGRITAEQGDCRGAIRLYRTALPIATFTNDYNYATGVLASMGKCYLKLGEMDKAKDMVDTIRLYIQKPDVWVSPHRSRDLYSLLSKYYMYKGDIPLSEMYADSTAMAEKEYEKVFSDQVILKARQETYEAQKKMRDDKIRASHNYILGLVVILALVAAIAVITILNSHRLRRKNRSLFERLKDHDIQAKEINRLRTLLHERPVAAENSSGKEKNGDDLYLRLSELMEDPTVYSDTKLTRKSLADKLYTNESYLRETILERTGLTVNEYITGIRLTRARQLLLSADRKYTAQEIAQECGFGGVSTFYRLFKTYYGITPEQFRYSADEK